MSQTIRIKRGVILAYRVYDAGDTIALDVAEKRIGARRVIVGGPLAEGLVIPRRPLEVELGGCTLPFAEPIAAHAHARIYDFGAVSIVYEIAIAPGTTLEELTPICDRLYDAPELDIKGREHRAALVKRLGDSVEKPHEWAESETYTIVFVQELEGCSVEEVGRSEQLVKLLLGETSPKPLSAGVRDEVLKHSFSYQTDDIAVVDWNSAFVVEPSGSRLVPFVLELATSQLLEFRYYDTLVDTELARVYEEVERARTKILRSPYATLTKQMLGRFMELTEFTERTDNAIKSVGDFFLARLYGAAIRRFRVAEWRESVESKLEIVSRAYELLKSDVEVSRTTLLELIVIVLILVELLAALRGHG
ncbi:MAG TPA: hypothetical protein VIF62_39420 [Labilithrix sp.]